MAADFNLPGWDWKTTSLKPYTKHANIYHNFTDILDDHGLQQMVEEPTRESNTPDLITNYPNCFVRIETIPGISDHDIVFVELKTIQLNKPKSKMKYHCTKKNSHMTMEQSICTKANKTIGFLKWNLNLNNTNIKETAYKSLANQPWSMHAQSGSFPAEQQTPAGYGTKQQDTSLTYITTGCNLHIHLE
ncbi:unnamed protein product [Mytilus coruscus]|uniref:Endonuclease/exonuclease/phosphatase domain-containing protein n=1 Tax=Mytilus coruscus TaxID=42192 RepID=A0A6J8DV17_MYTCO|nr:unnamed protein product [Mytilus coruscus]